MEKQINFCGGLPRSGSTVLMSIMQQNPRIFTTGTCPIPHIVKTVAIDLRNKEEFIAMDIDKSDEALHGFVTHGVQGWFNALTDKPIVISKNRSWTDVMHVFPNGKYIALIRDLRDVVESFDRIGSKIKLLHTYDLNSGALVPAMADDEKFHYYFKSGNPLSTVLAYELPRIVDLSQKTSNILIIRYEDLVLDPFKALNTIYEFIGEDEFEHDFDNIESQVLYEHDSVYYRERTSHKVSPSILTKVREPRQNSEEFLDRVVQENKLYYEMFYPEIL